MRQIESTITAVATSQRLVRSSITPFSFLPASCNYNPCNDIATHSLIHPSIWMMMIITLTGAIHEQTKSSLSQFRLFCIALPYMLLHISYSDKS